MGGMGELLLDRFDEAGSHVEAHELNAGQAFGAELVEEGGEGVAGLAFAGPDDACAVMIEDDGDVAMVSAEAELVDPDRAQVLEAILVELLSDQALSDATDGRPGDAEEIRDRGMVELLGEEAHGILEGTRERAPMPGPRDRLGLDLPARRTAKPPDGAFDPGRGSREGEVTPSAGRLLEPPLHAGGALGTGEQLEATPDLDHHRPAFESDPLDPQPLQGEQLVE